MQPHSSYGTGWSGMTDTEHKVIREVQWPFTVFRVTIPPRYSDEYTWKSPLVNAKQERALGPGPLSKGPASKEKNRMALTRLWFTQLGIEPEINALEADAIFSWPTTR